MTPHIPLVTCPHCNAWYNSERELRNHMQTAHRVFGAGQSNFNHPVGPPDASTIHPSTDKS